jgi:hypothetical protein
MNPRTEGIDLIHHPGELSWKGTGAILAEEDGGHSLREKVLEPGGLQGITMRMWVNKARGQNLPPAIHNVPRRKGVWVYRPDMIDAPGMDQDPPGASG